MALDLMLRSLVKSSQFNVQAEKNWNSVSKLIPGSTPKQCQRRYEELLTESLSAPNITQSASNLSLARSHTSSSHSIRYLKEDEGREQKSSRPSSAKRALKRESSESTIKTSSSRPVSGDHGPTMVIHVCDEVKNVKQDFHCPRDLLIAEMKYFAEYLSTDASRWEEVDISVHCDVQIFDWLMKYVKRGTKEVQVAPKLEPINVISILISSDFLKMDTLVQECIEYCHRNMNAIISTPCNMNCINDKLVTRIADLFSHNEADEIRDRKDKFKSKIFAKKVEQLFSKNSVDGNHGSSKENASTLYKCAVCKRFLTRNLEDKLRCLNSRLTIDRGGHLAYTHKRDPGWDVNAYLLDLKTSLKSWRDVYWRVWGTVNYLQCSRCEEFFQCCELAHCQYHPDIALFDSVSKDPTKCAMGQYECCGQKTYKFDPIKTNQGCKVRDHVVSMATDKDSINNDTKKTEVKGQHAVYNDLLAHRDVVCVPYQRLHAHTDKEVQINVFQPDELTGSTQARFLSMSENGTAEVSSKNDNLGSKPRLEPLTVEVMESEEYDIDESEDEVGDNEEPKVRKGRVLRKARRTVDPRAILLDAPDFSTTTNRKWDSSRSVRWNQDAQREEDQRRMKDMVVYLTRLRFSNEKLDKMKQKEYNGGTFSKIEAQWRATNAPPIKGNPSLTRGKPRLAQLR